MAVRVTANHPRVQRLIDYQYARLRGRDWNEHLTHQDIVDDCIQSIQTMLDNEEDRERAAAKARAEAAAADVWGTYPETTTTTQEPRSAA